MITVRPQRNYAITARTRRDHGAIPMQKMVSERATVCVGVCARAQARAIVLACLCAIVRARMSLSRERSNARARDCARRVSRLRAALGALDLSLIVKLMVNRSAKL